MSKFELYSLIYLIVFVVAEFVFIPLYYARKWKMTYVAACKEFYVEGLFGTFKQDFKKGFKAFCSEVKKVAKLLYKCICAFIEWCKPPKPKHIFTEDLDCALYSVISEYVYAPFMPELMYYYVPTSRVELSLYTKSIVTPDVAQELVWHTQAVFQRYLTAYGLNFDYTVIPNTVDNKIKITIFYSEYPEEYPLYRQTCRQAMYLGIEQSCPSFPEELAVKTSSVVLGYNYDKWQCSGQVVPILWDLNAAPHAIFAGPSGSGKSIYTLTVLEQLLLLGAEVCVCDYKGYGDYDCYRGAYATGNDCDDMLFQFCSNFEKMRSEGKGDGKTRVLIFDEFCSYALSKDKKQHNELMKLISGVFFLGRSYNYHIILVSQRFDAESLNTAYREQCGIKVHCGSNISQQSATMLYTNADINKSIRLQELCAYISTPKIDIDVMITPRVDIEALNKRIEKLSSKT